MTIALGLCNVRDVGGLPTENGPTTRAGVLYRSDAPQPGDRPPAWPPRTVLDLRSTRERALAGRFPGGRDALAALRTPEAIEHVLDVVDGHSEGAAGWLRAHGASGVDLERWTERLVGAGS
jgi:hypothetical protein